MPHKPLLIDPRVLRPLPQSMWNMACTICDRRLSRWEVFDFRDDAIAPKARHGRPVCSLCWLYKSEWGKANRADIDLMIRDVELDCGFSFERSLVGEIVKEGERQPDGRLQNCKDADRVLAAIAVTSRVFTFHDRISHMEPDDES